MSAANTAWPLGEVTVLGAHILDVLGVDLAKLGAKVLAGGLGAADWFLPNGDQLLALTGRHDLGPAIKDVMALGTAAVAVTLGADSCLVATGLGSDAGIENFAQVLDFLGHTQPAVAGRIKEQMK